MRITGSSFAAENMGVTLGLNTETFPSAGELVLSMPLLCGTYYCGRALPLKLCGQLVFELEVTKTSSHFFAAAAELPLSGPPFSISCKGASVVDNPLCLTRRGRFNRPSDLRLASHLCALSPLDLSDLPVCM